MISYLKVALEFDRRERFVHFGSVVVNYQLSGRVIGFLVLVQFAAGIAVNAVLTAPLFGEPGYLQAAAANSLQLGWSVLLALLGSLIAIAVACIAYPIFKRRSESFAVAYLAIVSVGAAVLAIEQVGYLTMIAFSEAYTTAGDDQATFEALRVAGSALRNGAHYYSLLVSGVMLGLWYLLMWRFSLLPRLIAGFGMFAVSLQLYAISQPILGGAVFFPLLAPLALAQILQGGWLLWRGFPEPQST